MRFRSLMFRRFGVFDERTLEFPTENRDLHVVFGPNEAGKSTALAGLGYFLFGFEHLATHNFRFSHTEQRIGASLLNCAGQSLTALRRRANKNAFRESDDKTPLPDDCLGPYLGGLDREQFDMLFGIDHDQLVAGGRSMATGKGSLGQALFAAGAGLTGLRRIDESLKDRLDELFLKNGRKQAIAVALKQINDERQSLKEETVAIGSWMARREELERAAEKRGLLEAEQAELLRNEKLLEAYRSALPAIEALNAVENNLRAVRDTVQLPVEFGENYRKTIASLREAEQERDRQSEKVRAAESANGKIELNPETVAAEVEILGFKERFGAIREAQEERASLLWRIRECEEMSRRILRHTSEMETPVSGPGFDAAARDRIAALIDAHSEIEQSLQYGRERLAQTATQIQDIERRLAQPTAAFDAAALDAVERDILQHGPIESMRESEIQAFRDGRAEATADMERLRPVWQGPLKAVPRLIVPAVERIAPFEAELEAVDGEIQELGRRRDEADQSLRESLQQLIHRESSSSVPDEAALAKARASRDRAIARLSTTRPPSPAELDTIRTRIKLGDDIVDALRREAERGGEVAAIRKDADAKRQAHSEAIARLEVLSRRRTEIFARWALEWKPAGIQPMEPRAMRLWLERWSALKKKVEQLEESGREVKRLDGLLDGQKAAIRAALGLDPSASDVQFADLRNCLRVAIEEARATGQNRQESETLLREARAQRTAAEEQLAAADVRLESWRAEWSQTVSLLGMSGDVEPKAAREILQRHQEASRHINEIEAAKVRLAKIHQNRDEFIGKLDVLCIRLQGRPLDSNQMGTAIDDLVTRLTDAKLRQRDFERIRDELTASSAALAEATRRVAESQAHVSALCEQAGFATPEELPEMIRNSEERNARAKEAAQLRSQLVPLAAGQDLDAFLASEAKARPNVKVRLDAIRSRLDVVRREIPESAIAAAAAQAQIDEWQRTGAKAADRRQSIELLMAQLREHVTEYAGIHLAREMLRLTVDRFREQRRDSLLSAAERYFQILTQGAFRGLDVDDDNGEPVLLAVRSNPGESIRVDGLSDGTRDQLFLALRLAGIEQHIRTHGPMPVVIDDVLVNFDDARAAAALECLAQLSKQTQVLLFTHEASVVELAKRVAAEAVCCHDLSAVAAEPSPAGG